jgi:MFS transporter, AAHS family, 4-hydroxybenzoate transporter
MNKTNINNVLDNANTLGLPLLVIVVSTLILVLDGLDIQIISLVAPLLTREFHVAPASLGPVLSAALIGMALGAFLLGGLGDRWGRRPALLSSVALFSLTTLFAATVQSVVVLAGLRFLTGIGLGGAIPNAMALLAEFTGPRWRTQAVAMAGVGVPIGGMCGAMLGSFVIPTLGWRPMFIIGGLAPLALLAAIIFLLPESPRFLVALPHRRSALVKVLNRLAQAPLYSVNGEFEVTDSALKGRGNSLSILIAESLLRDTFWLWLIFLTNMFAIYLIVSWSPVILTAAGLSLTVAVRGSIVFNLVGVVGGLATAGIISRWGSRKPMATLAILGIVGLLMLSVLLYHAAHLGRPPNVGALMAVISLIGFAMIAIQMTAFRLSTHLYPTSIRASGIGWASGFGRVGGILSSLIGGWVLAMVHGAGLFAMLAGIVALTLIAVLAIQRHLVAVGAVKRTAG